MKRISAHYVFPVSSPPVRYGVVVTDGTGTITEVTDPGGAVREYAGTVFHNGVVVPGFIIFLKIAEDHNGEEAARVRSMLGGVGCRAAVVAFRDRAYREDMVAGTQEVMDAARVAEAERKMVVIRKEAGEKFGVRDLFPEPLGDIGAFEERLRALTLKGAEALGMRRAGALVPGYRPGIVVLEVAFERWGVGGRKV